jgi:hypothetical protein
MFSGLPQLASLFAQPAVLAAGVATGVAVGAVGVGTGAIPVSDPKPHNAPLYECPGSDRIVTSIAPNQNVLVTARTADGQWLQIYIGEGTADRGWAPASALQLKAAPDSLPVADCTPEATVEPVPTTLEPPSLAPSASAELPSAVPSVGPTPTPTRTPSPTKTPKPTPTPTLAPTPPTGPTLSAFTLNPYPGYWYIVEDPSGSGIYPIYQIGCTAGNWTVGFYIEAQDPDGIASMTLYYQPTGVASPFQESMGEEGPNEYYVEVVSNNEPPGEWFFGEVEYWITAVDGVGDSTTFHGPSNARLVYTVCND